MKKKPLKAKTIKAPVSYWNYSIIKNGKLYWLHEVYYTKGVAHTRTLKPIIWYFETPEELVEELETMFIDAEKNLENEKILDMAMLRKKEHKKK